MATKYYIGVLVLVILVSSIYVMLPDKIRIDVQKTKTIYRVYENDSWILAATEYVNLFDGTAKMRAWSRSVTNSTDFGIITIRRLAFYKDNIQTDETYVFDSRVSDVELVPILHETICINCVGKILQFEYRDILYDGETKDILSPFSFGHNMKLTWQDGAYRAKVYQQKVASDKIILRYRPVSDNEKFEVRLFDPLPSQIASDNHFINETEIKPNIFRIDRCENITETKHFTCFNNHTILYNYTFINNKTFKNESMTKLINISRTYDCKPYKAYYGGRCKTIGIRNLKVKLNCPLNYRCDVLSNEFCMLDCNNGDCNYNYKQRKTWGWKGKCMSIYDIRSVSVYDYKSITASVEKI